MNLEIHDIITIYLSRNIKNLSQTKWNKLMFFIDGAGVCKTGNLFTTFKYIKLPYGPVPDNYKQIIEEMARKELVKITKQIDISDSAKFIQTVEKDYSIDDEIKKTNTLDTVLRKTIELFGDWTAIQLSNFSHKTDAWNNAIMFGTIDMNKLKDDSYLKTKYKNGNWGDLLLSLS